MPGKRRKVSTEKYVVPKEDKRLVAKGLSEGHESVKSAIEILPPEIWNLIGRKVSQLNPHIGYSS
jgi:hypothetical protein